MKQIPISVRNTLNHPVRITVAVSGSGRNDDRILITIGEKGKSLKSYYGPCIDEDISLDDEWRDFGELTIDPTYDFAIRKSEEVKKLE